MIFSAARHWQVEVRDGMARGSGILVLTPTCFGNGTPPGRAFPAPINSVLRGWSWGH